MSLDQRIAVNDTFDFVYYRPDNDLSLAFLFKELCDSAEKGSRSSLVKLTSIIKECEKEAQLDRIVQIMKSHLHPKHLPPENSSLASFSTSPRFFNVAISLVGLGSTQVHFAKWASVEDLIIDAWPNIYRWIEFFHQHNAEFPASLAIVNSNMMLGILISFASSERLRHTIQSTCGILPVVSNMWSAEAKDPTTTNKKAAHVLYLYTNGLPVSLVHERVVTPHGGGEASVARTALRHL